MLSWAPIMRRYPSSETNWSRCRLLPPGGRLVFHVFAALAEFIRALIVIGTNEGLAAARACDLLPDSGCSITSIAKLLGVCAGTLYNHIPDLRELRAGAVPRQLGTRTREANPSKIVLAGDFLYLNYSPGVSHRPRATPSASGTTAHQSPSAASASMREKPSSVTLESVSAPPG